jgi:autotransporter-associated beta strand protein
LVKTGTGTLTLSGSNAYSGATTINAGTLALGAGGSIAASNGVTVAAGATFDVSASSQTVAALTNGGTVIVGDAATTTLTVTGNYVGNGGTLSVSGPLTGISPIHIGGTASGSTLVTYTGPSSPPANCGDVLLVQDGSGSSGTFALAGGASARLSVGGCQYRLAQGAAGNWYLESSPFSVGSVPVPTLDRMALALLALLLAIGAAITGMRRY